jgi:hypothetical protein
MKKTRSYVFGGRINKPAFTRNIIKPIIKIVPDSEIPKEKIKIYQK